MGSLVFDWDFYGEIVWTCGWFPVWESSEKQVNDWRSFCVLKKAINLREIMIVISLDE